MKADTDCRHRVGRWVHGAKNTEQSSACRGETGSRMKAGVGEEEGDKEDQEEKR